MTEGWIKVKSAGDCSICELCEDYFCEDCNEHYSDCDCIGPHQDDEYEYEFFRNDLGIDELYARKINND